MGISELDRLRILREAARNGRDPSCTDETLNLLIGEARKVHAQNILEIGAAEGLTSVAFALFAGVKVTAIEKDPDRARRARINFALFSAQESVLLLEGDAGEILPTLEGEFDLIFLDAAKVQYRRYFPDCKRLLRRGGVLVSDDVLLRGWVTGEAPKKRKMLARHLREYLDLLCADPDFRTEIIETGDGVAVSYKL